MEAVVLMLKVLCESPPVPTMSHYEDGRKVSQLLEALAKNPRGVEGVRRESWGRIGHTSPPL